MNAFSYFKTYRGLPKSVYVIFAAQIINRFGDFVRPFMTLLLTTQFDLSIAQTGVYVMLTTMMTFPGGLIGGKIADLFGRKKTYLVFQFLAGLSLLICGFIYKSWWMVILIMLSSFFGGAVRPTISAILTDVLSPEDRQRGFSLSYLGINLGVAIGPIIAGFLFNHFIAMVFIGDAITSFIAVFLVAIHIEESLPDEEALEKVSKDEAHVEGSIIKALISRPQLMLFLFFNIFYSASYAQTGFSIPLILKAKYGLEGAPIFGTLMSFNAIVVIVFTIMITGFSAKFRTITNVVIAGMTYIIGYGMIAFINHLSLFWVSTFCWTVGEIIMAVNFGVFIANQTPANFRARFNAVMSLSYGVGSVIGTAVIGWLIDIIGIEAVWFVVAGLAGVGTLGMLGLRTYMHRVELAESSG